MHMRSTVIRLLENFVPCLNNCANDPRSDCANDAISVYELVAWVVTRFFHCICNHHENELWLNCTSDISKALNSQETIGRNDILSFVLRRIFCNSCQPLQDVIALISQRLTSRIWVQCRRSGRVRENLWQRRHSGWKSVAPCIKELGGCIDTANIFDWTFFNVWQKWCSQITDGAACFAVSACHHQRIIYIFGSSGIKSVIVSPIALSNKLPTIASGSLPTLAHSTSDAADDIMQLSLPLRPWAAELHTGNLSTGANASTCCDTLADIRTP